MVSQSTHLHCGISMEPQCSSTAQILLIPISECYRETSVHRWTRYFWAQDSVKAAAWQSMCKSRSLKQYQLCQCSQKGSELLFENKRALLMHCWLHHIRSVWAGMLQMKTLLATIGRVCQQERKKQTEDAFRCDRREARR